MNNRCSEQSYRSSGPDRTIHNTPSATEYTYPSSTHRVFLSINHIFNDKTNLNAFKETEIKPNVILNNSEIELEINDRRKVGKLKLCGN